MTLGRLLKRISIVEEEEKQTGGSLLGLKVVFTGKLSSRSRDSAKRFVKAAGGETPTGLSKSTDVLVVGQKASKKRNKAEEMGVVVVEEADFFADGYVYEPFEPPEELN